MVNEFLLSILRDQNCLEYGYALLIGEIFSGVKLRKNPKKVDMKMLLKNSDSYKEPSFNRCYMCGSKRKLYQVGSLKLCSKCRDLGIACSHCGSEQNLHIEGAGIFCDSCSPRNSKLNQQESLHGH